MKTFFYSKWLQAGLILLLAIPIHTSGQQKEWDRTFGGDNSERLYSLQQTTDGGYILGGFSISGVSGDKSADSKGGFDFWVVKLNASGEKEWDKTFGGAGDDNLTSLQQTTDGGYILGGSSLSDIGGDKSEVSRGNYDYWVVKLNAAGEKQWDRTYGGSDLDQLNEIRQTSDGGYILGGLSFSGASGDKTEDSRGDSDYWVLKLNHQGEKEWDKTFGGNRGDLLTALQQTYDGGYILGGYSSSGISIDKSEASKGRNDFWIVKLNAQGNKEWDKTIGGDSVDELHALEQTQDGGYILGGESWSGISGDKSEVNRRPGDSEFYGDYWVVKVDASGNKEWDRTYGGESAEILYSLKQTIDNGYILGGVSDSGASGDKTEDSRGGADYWIVKLDADGEKVWDRTFGGDDYDALWSLQQTHDGGYILGGESWSGISGDKSEASRGSGDFWIIKLGPDETCTPPTPAITIIPTSDVYTGGNPATIYLGYGPQNVRLEANGGESFTWSPATGLSSITIADPVFTPATSGSYTFTVTAYTGLCSATATITITVIDVRCGNGKIWLCHKGQKLCLAPAAVANHLRQHSGDQLGSCQEDVRSSMALRVYPNPFSSRTLVEFSLPVADSYRLELYHASGKMLDVVAEGKARSNQLVSLELRGEKLREGIYYLRLITKDEVQTTRLVLKK